MNLLSKPNKQETDRVVEGDRLLVVESLFEAWQPLIFTTLSVEGQKLLAYSADESAEGAWFILVPISDEKVAGLKGGTLAIRDALTSSWMWLCLESEGPLQTWPVSVSEINELCLPKPGVMLYPEYEPETEPVFVTRAIGSTLKLGIMPSSVVSYVSSAARSAFKTILDHISANNSQGRPPQSYRAVYDLPISNIAFASFSVAFGPPPESLFPNEDFETAKRLLETGLQWASSATDDTFDTLEAKDDAERAAILRAVRYLTPPSTGAISEMEVSGTWLDARKISLRRASGTKVRKALNNMPKEKERVVIYTGRIDQLDHDRLEFSLRDMPDGELEKRCSFDLSLLEDVHEHNNTQGTVTITAIERGGRLQVTAITNADTEEESDS